jgi:hypothetical protein
VAGTAPGGFDAAAFRAGIHTAMVMGAPVDDADAATFCFPATVTYDRPVDADNLPFDPGAQVTRVPRPPVRVPVAVEYRDETEQLVNFGYVTPAYAVITLLDEDYAQVTGCEYVLLRGSKFRYQSTAYPQALFTVGVYVMHFVSEDTR